MQFKPGSALVEARFHLSPPSRVKSKTPVLPLPCGNSSRPQTAPQQYTVPPEASPHTAARLTARALNVCPPVTSEGATAYAGELLPMPSCPDPFWPQQ
jgi:hypothetical protein